MSETNGRQFLTPVRRLMIGIASLAVAFGTLVAPVPSEAQAVTATDFQAGNIISNALFYDGDAMSTSQVSSFLKKRVPDCTIGDSGRKAGSAWGSTQIAKKCLRDFTMTTKTKSANAYCKAYTGKQGESAATIITKVGKACGISQKVLLIMLEKEQSLVTDTWPTVRQFDVAMGYACPDSGPNNSANCDATYSGFFNQVYLAAWQLKVYKAKPASYNYRAFATNTIQYHPNTACGTSKVYVENEATAALYIYTPYRPNKAALSAGWGTGNNCSSYGNRNFYLYYKTWFGSTQLKPLNGVIKKYYDANGGAKAFGEQIKAKVVHTKNGGGVSQRFEKGLIAYSKSLGKTVFVPNGSTLSLYLAKGGPDGAWGWPKAAQTYAKSTKVYQTTFQRGLAVGHPTIGVKFVPSKTLKVWKAEGGASGWLGYPKQHGVVVSSKTAYQRFEHGTVFFSSGRQTTLTASAAAKWRAEGGFKKLGVATTNTKKVGSQGLWFNTSKAAVYAKNGGARIAVKRGPLLTAYKEAGGPAKQGWPKTAYNCTLKGGACKLTLDRKTVVYAKKTGASFVAKNHYTYWSKLGSKRYTKLGFPVKSTKTLDAGTLQRYQNGMTAISNSSGKVVVLPKGKIMSAYVKSGWYRSSWGLPLSVNSGATTVKFSNGTAKYRNGKVTFTAKSGKKTVISIDTSTLTTDPDTQATDESAGAAEETPEESTTPEKGAEQSAVGESDAGADASDGTGSSGGGGAGSTDPESGDAAAAAGADDPARVPEDAAAQAE